MNEPSTFSKATAPYRRWMNWTCNRCGLRWRELLPPSSITGRSLPDCDESTICDGCLDRMGGKPIAELMAEERLHIEGKPGVCDCE